MSCIFIVILDAVYLYLGIVLYNVTVHCYITQQHQLPLFSCLQTLELRKVAVEGIVPPGTV